MCTNQLKMHNSVNKGVTDDDYQEQQSDEETWCEETHNKLSAQKGLLTSSLQEFYWPTKVITTPSTNVCLSQ